MDLIELEIFCAVAEGRSITRAAAQLNRVQSNVTTRIKHLEHDLGVPLFFRGGRGMTLTPAGERLLGYAHKILAPAREARHALGARVPSGVLRIGTVESVAELWLPCVIGTYHQRWSDVQIEVSTNTSRALVDQVRGGAIECAFVAQVEGGAHVQAELAADSLIGESGLHATKIGGDELLAVLPASSGMSAARRYTIATTAEGNAYRALAHNWLADNGVDIDPQQEAIELSSYPALLMSAMVGDVIALFPRSVLEPLELPRGSSTVRFAVEHLPRQQRWLYEQCVR
ncbi:LysR family transcriptional regulator (plasmid) [Paraburkholderia sprentiae WSM5005]|uniref:LysR family transcriptional regulator n=1 Tax=Paraburkholderia sprentiae WSM5005 TaxID=754502 RepID=A0A8F4KJ99_9BURK|nr:LysR family transcriptional regulator [Paraburkholderia sprentiae]QXE07377.1 LysR family transcriptional regulator [Paraburkholderia sprentiae WSM5005]